MKAVVELFGGIVEKVYLVNDEFAETLKSKLEKGVGILTDNERESRGVNGKEEFMISDVDYDWGLKISKEQRFRGVYDEG